MTDRSTVQLVIWWLGGLAASLLRLLTLRPCREPFCHERVRCWRWHVEVFTCPTCKREVDECDPQFGAVVGAVVARGPVFITEPPKTWTTGGQRP